VFEVYSRTQLEAALSSCGFTILQEVGSLVLYQTHFSPGGDLVIDWSRGQYEWEDFKKQLDFQGIPLECIRADLTNEQ